MPRRGRLVVGTSGYVYAHWRDRFYPRKLPQREWFAYYAARFHGVEINNTFYRLPSEETIADWRSRAPPGFDYAVKMHRRVTHMKRLRDPHETLPEVVERYAGLGDSLGPVLVQLPPRWRADDEDVERLRKFLAALPQGPRYALETRDASWEREEVRDALSERDVAWCIHDLSGEWTPRWITSGLVYVRFHGPDGPYRGKYGARRLSSWAKRIDGWLAQGLDVCAFFNNDQDAFATEDAAWLARKLGRDASAARLTGPRAARSS